MNLKGMITRIPVFGDTLRQQYWRFMDKKARQPFPGSREYWDRRYARDGNSGSGSYGRLALFKAEILNGFVAENGIGSVIEFGCGDGAQLQLGHYARYIGLDVSATAIARCRAMYATDQSKSFKLVDEYDGERAELSLSLDVIYHLVEDAVYSAYMRRLFDAAQRYVAIYSSNTDDNDGYEDTHVRHRQFTRWIEQQAPTWQLVKYIPNRYPYTGDYHETSFADFFIYGRR